MRRIGAVAVVLAAVSNASAQDMAPLSDYLAQPDDHRVTAYPYERCAGLYMALGNLAENATEPVGMPEQFVKVALALTRRGALERLRTSPGTDSEAASDGALKAVSLVMERYQTRMIDNYATTGDHFGRDALITGDLRSCTPIAQRALDGFGD